MSNGINTPFTMPQIEFDVGVGSTPYVNPIGITTSNLPYMAGGPAGTGSGVGGFLGGLGGFLDNLTSSDILQTGLSAAALQDQMSRLSGIGSGLAAGAREIGEEAQAASAFRPFTVSTGFGGVQATPEGGFTTTLDPQQAAQQQQLQALTGSLLGGMGGVAPDVSGIQRQALGGVGVAS